MSQAENGSAGRPFGAGRSSFSAVISDAVAASGDSGWRVEHDVGPEKVWIRVFCPGRPVPDQGWKLHVSAVASSAVDVLKKALAVLLTEDAAFKVATESALETLNGGDAGLSQVGKFITVYPRDDDQAVRIAVALDRATRGLRGPAVPYEQAISDGGLVHYRYGPFTERLEQDPSGALVPVISTPDGRSVPDRASGRPDWASDPFAQAGLGAPPPARVVGGRYAPTDTLHSSGAGAVYLALDTQERRVVILKRARRDTRVGTDGKDARDYLRAEADILERLQPNESFPRPLGLVEHERDLYLVMEHIEGPQLGEYLAAFMRSGRSVPGDTLINWGRALAQALGHVHQAGFVYRDLNPANVLIAEGGRPSLVDFGFAVPIGGRTSSVGIGTRGFTSREQLAGRPPAVTDDVYGLGTLLYFIATGADPAEAPQPLDLTSRPLRLLNPALSGDLIGVIARCLAAEPDGRPQSMDEVDELLAALSGRAVVEAPGIGEEDLGEPEEGFRARCRRNARRLGDTLTDLAAPMERARGERIHTGPLDISGGTAGVVLALAELVGEFDDVGHRRVLDAAARSLSGSPVLQGPALPGLYVGVAGVGAALLRAGQVTGNDDYISVAADLSRRVATMDQGGPDLYNGTAGRARYHLLVWDETGGDEHLEAAVGCGEHLLARAEVDASGARWATGEHRLTGYAHGAAGIADVLLDLYEASGREGFVEGAAEAGRWLLGLAEPALDDGSGLTWREFEGGPRSAATWCRGAAGIGRFLLHANDVGVVEGARDAALGAAKAVARAGRAIDPSQCHGLSGNIEFLLDAAGSLRDERFRREAFMVGRVLESWALELDGALVWPSDIPDSLTPHYVTGYSGVAICLLRVADGSRPHLLSRKGFRFLKNHAIEATPA